mmetsp:Transcript_60629/g.195315  ORF Transcript_60629/g.195315 Transcript_60629/m.195315 type:complete len:207 (+) Transcript_60629:1288-1908(+)
MAAAWRQHGSRGGAWNLVGKGPGVTGCPAWVSGQSAAASSEAPTWPASVGPWEGSGCVPTWWAAAQGPEPRRQPGCLVPAGKVACTCIWPPRYAGPIAVGGLPCARCNCPRLVCAPRICWRACEHRGELGRHSRKCQCCPCRVPCCSGDKSQGKWREPGRSALARSGISHLCHGLQDWAPPLGACSCQAARRGRRTGACGGRGACG